MKVVFITTSLTTGGAELMLLKILQHFDRRYFETTVISLRSKGEVGPSIEALGIPVFALGMRPGLSALVRLPALVRILRKIKPDLVQTWMHHADLLGGLAARLAGCSKVVWGLRQSNLSVENSKRSSRTVLMVCAPLSSRIPVKILSCSIKAQEVHAALGYPQDKMHVIPNGFDLNRFRPDGTARQSVRDELKLTTGTLLVGLMGRYDPQKNHAGFIEAAAFVHARLPDVHFVLAGSNIDAYNATLRALIRENGLDACVHLLGRRDDMPRLMAALDVLVSSSFSEAFPNVLGEAMACAVPCVVTDVGDSAEIVGGTGRVASVVDMRGLAQQIVELLCLPAEERVDLGRLARERVAANYEIGQITRLYQAFYEQINAH